MGADRHQWQFPANEASKVLGWRSDGKGMENKDWADPSTKQDADSNLDTLSSGTTTLGAKGLALLEAADAGAARAEIEALTYVSTRTALKALDTTEDTAAFLTEGGREGIFIWNAGDYSAEISADTQEGVYVKADAVASTSGAWVRQYDGNVYANWFGLSPAASAANNNTYLQAALDFAKTQTETILSNKYIITTSDVLVDCGEYDISGAVELYTGVRLIGSGQSNTLFKHAGGASDFLVLTASGSENLYNVWVMDLAIKGGGKTTSDTLAAVRADKGTGALAIYSCGVAKCLITNCYDGVGIENSWTFELVDVDMYDMGRNFVRGENVTAAKFIRGRYDVAAEDGLYVTFSSTASLETIALHLDSIIVQSCQRRAIYGYDADHVMWDHCYVENNNQAGGYPAVEFASNSGTNAEMYSFVGGWASPSTNTGQPAFKIAKARHVSSVGIYIRGNAFNTGWDLGSDVDSYFIAGDANGPTAIVSSANASAFGIAVNRQKLSLGGLGSEISRISQTSSNVNSDENIRVHEINCTSGNRSYTLQDAHLQPGRRFTVQKVDGGANLLVINREGTTKINGAASSVSDGTAYVRAEIVCGHEAGTTTPCWYVTFV